MPTIALISPNRWQYSETFIHQQVRLLPYDVHYFFGGHLPHEVCIGRINMPARPLLSNRLWTWAMQKTGCEKKALQQAIIRHLKRHKISAIVAQYGPTGVEMLPIAQQTGLPLIVYFHGYDAYRNDVLAYYSHAYQQLFDQSAAILTASQDMKQTLINMGAPASKVHHLLYGFDERLFRSGDAGSNPPHFLFVGRLVESKAPHIALLAFSYAHRQHPDLRLEIIGDGALKESCICLAQALGISDLVHFRGACPPHVVAQTMQQMRGFFLPSMTAPISRDSEGTPVVILEAAASGLPVVSTFHAGIPEVVIDGKTGFLCQEADADAMGKHLLFLAKNPAIATQMGQFATKHAAENFTLAHHINRLEAIVASVLK